ncbi:MAG: tetratricopeptide repeat protein, partial [Thermodesulfobacteriota bacterium]
LIAADYDLGPYIQTLTGFLPKPSIPRDPLPRLGKIKISIDADKGMGKFSASMKTDDIREMIAYFKEFPVSKPEGTKDAGPVRSDEEKETAFLIEKGILASMQGDYPGAAGHFETVIRKYPKNSDAHFFLGLAYQEMGDVSKALSSLSKAIALNPEKGDYYYGRGRTYLLAKESQKAMADFNQAATLGNEDARTYLKSASKFK